MNNNNSPTNANWEKVEISDICQIRRGASPRPIDDPIYFSSNGRGWIRISDVSSAYKWLTKTEQYLSENGVKKSVSVEIGSLIMSICATIGKPIIVKIPACIHDGFVLFDNLNQEIDTEFLFYFLLQNEKNISKNKQIGTQGNLNTKIVNSIEFIKPPIQEQKTIAAILCTIDEAIAAAEAQLTKQEKIKQGLLQDLMKRGIDETGQIRPHWEDRPDLYKKTELGYLPIAWEVKTIDSLANYVGSGVTPRGGSEVYKNSGILFIRSQNVTFDGLKLADVAYIDQSTHEAMQSSEIMAHDVLLNITGASIGRCCPVPKSLGIANVNQHVCAIRLPKPNEQDANYLSLVLSSYIGQDQIARLNAGGNREGLNYQQIRSFLIPWPKDLERSQIVENLAFHKEDVISGGKELSKLKRIKTGLMQDLLTGQRRVTSELIRQVEILTGSA